MFWEVRDVFVSLERVVRVGALDFRRLMGQAGSSSDVFGGGGSGEELISPIRRRVSVNWAFVGTPSRRVLYGVSEGVEEDEVGKGTFGCRGGLSSLAPCGSRDLR